MMIFGGIFWLIIILLILYTGRSLLKKNKKEDKENLLNALERRLANGEILEEEFKRLKKILNLERAYKKNSSRRINILFPMDFHVVINEE